MVSAGSRQKVYRVARLAGVVSALEAEGVAPARALQRVGLSVAQLHSPETRVSLDQVIRCYRNASELSADPDFAYRTGLRFHVSTYGMFGFAILSSTNFRQAIRFAIQYRQLAVPAADISFREEGRRGIWTTTPIAHPDVDAMLYRFIVKLEFGTQTSVHRDVISPSFTPRELRVTYGAAERAPARGQTFGCPVLFDQAENALVFDSRWLDGTPELGNEQTYRELLKLCDQLMIELKLRIGLAGSVREALLINLARPMGLDAVAKRLKMAPRTLRRKLREEGTSYRKIVDELRMQVSIKYLRDTDLTIVDIASALGFSDAGNFRQAFWRWTKAAPTEFRDEARKSRD